MIYPSSAPDVWVIHADIGRDAPCGSWVEDKGFSSVEDAQRWVEWNYVAGQYYEIISQTDDVHSRQWMLIPDDWRVRGERRGRIITVQAVRVQIVDGKWFDGGQG